jgi:hypothetical protein
VGRRKLGGALIGPGARHAMAAFRLAEASRSRQDPWLPLLAGGIAPSNTPDGHADCGGSILVILVPGARACSGTWRSIKPRFVRCLLLVSLLPS